MAKNQVTLTFAGDSQQLEKSFDTIGDSAKRMEGDVSKSAREVGTSFDKAGDGLDNTYDKFDSLEAIGRGTTDTMSGLSEIMKGNVLQGSTDLAGGVAALADGFSGALIPALKAGTTGFKAAASAVKVFTLSLLTNPVFLIIAALLALGVGLVVLYRKSDTARKVMQTAFKFIGSSALAMARIGLQAFQFLTNAALTSAEKVIRAAAAIPGPQQKHLKRAADSIRGFRDSANESFNGAIRKVNQWDAKIRGLPNTKKIRITVSLDAIVSRQYKNLLSGKLDYFGNTINVPGRAMGGPVAAGTLYEVNERGREFFRPSVNGTVIPLGGGGAGGGTVQVVLSLEGRGDLVELLRKSIKAKGAGRDPVRVLRS